MTREREELRVAVKPHRRDGRRKVLKRLERFRRRVGLRREGVGAVDVHDACA